MNKKDTFLEAIQTNQGLLFKIASVYTNSVEDRNDLLQEINYQLWKSIETFNQQSSLSTWMYRVAMNVAIYHLKATKRRVPTVPIDNELLSFKGIANTEKEERWKLLNQSINQLNLLEKGIVILYLEDKSYEEIGEIIGISKSNVGTKLMRIKEKLKQQISKQS